MPKRRKASSKSLSATNLTVPREEEPDLTDPTQYLDEIDSFHSSRQGALRSQAAAGGFQDPLLSASEGETSSDEYAEREEVLPLELSSSEEAEHGLGEVRQYFSDGSAETGSEEGGWGRRKRTFYDTDFVGDEKKGRREDVELALEEEREALSLQKKLTEGLTESDFLTHDLLSTLATSRPDNATRLDTASELQLCDSPEIAELTRDLETHLSQLSGSVLPALRFCRSASSPPDSLLHYLDTRSRLSLAYCGCILFFLSLRASGIPVATHPVCARLVSCRSLLAQMSVMDKDLQPQIQVWLAQQQASTNGENGAKINSNDDEISIDDEVESDEPNEDLISSDSDINLSETANQFQTKPASSLDKYSSLTPLQFYDAVMKEREEKQRKKANRPQSSAQPEEEPCRENGDTKRAINYSMKKNKGLTPLRKKEMRNPRVHQRLRYKRALKRRKGQVAGMRPRSGLYPGEMTGIRDDISKSRKILS